MTDIVSAPEASALTEKTLRARERVERNRDKFLEVALPAPLTCPVEGTGYTPAHRFDKTRFEDIQVGSVIAIIEPSRAGSWVNANNHKDRTHAYLIQRGHRSLPMVVVSRTPKRITVQPLTLRPAKPCLVPYSDPETMGDRKNSVWITIAESMHALNAEIEVRADAEHTAWIKSHEKAERLHERVTEARSTAGQAAIKAGAPWEDRVALVTQALGGDVTNPWRIKSRPTDDGVEIWAERPTLYSNPEPGDWTALASAEVLALTIWGRKTMGDVTPDQAIVAVEAIQALHEIERPRS